MNKDEILDMVEACLTVFTPHGPEGHRLMKELFSVKMEDKEEIGGGTKL